MSKRDLIDFDGLFEEKLSEYIRMNAGKYSEKQWENIIPKLYQQFGDIYVAKAGATPKGYYAAMSDEVISAALLAPKQEVYLDIGEKNVMSVDIPVYDIKTRTPDPNDIYSYGYAFTSSELDDAVKSLADILPDMLKLAEIEKSCLMMASEIEKTRRRVNALEHVMIPDTQEKIRYITMKLDENERSTQTRLMKVKDMMLKEAHGY